MQQPGTFLPDEDARWKAGSAYDTQPDSCLFPKVIFSADVLVLKVHCNYQHSQQIQIVYPLSVQGVHVDCGVVWQA